ncbi:MAG: aminotransferase class V-fold PLP-dependent enzyme [Gemmataceae bacterium]|nr:aminotransferase class V-fold PLP-dependent enzyme [Gemmataceae bacterium]MDW8265459.1 aminotransferase class V-fold PLP-dependent enzyme [Gemmataceae bacterium]
MPDDVSRAPEPDRLDALRRRLATPLPHPDAAEVRGLGRLTAEWALRYFETVPEQSVGRTASRTALEAMLRQAPPESGRPFADVLADFADKVVPHAFRVNHPRFLAFIPGAPSVFSVLGEWLCASTNFFNGVWLAAAGPAEVELVVLDWFKAWVGYPPTARGLLTSGGSEANLLALVAARHLLSPGERSRAVLYVTEQRHKSVDRAASIMGLRPEQVRPVPADGQFRLTGESLERAIRQDEAAGRLPWAVVANAGATNTGTVDPLRELAEVCHRRPRPLWLHVDAAYGWPAVLVPEGRAALDGLAEADSITLDPHKWFAQTFDAGGLLVREGHRLAAAFAQRPDYMQDVFPGEDEINFSDHGLALTRRFRALKIWLSVQVLGLDWFRQLIDHCCRLAEFAQLLLEQTPGFEILSPRQLSVLCFRHRPPSDDPSVIDRHNRTLAFRLRESGHAFLATTRLLGRVALRMCFVNWRTTSGDVEVIVEQLASLAAEMSESAPAGRELARPPA